MIKFRVFTILTFFLILLPVSWSCISMSQATNVAPVGSPTLLGKDEIAGGFGGTIAGGGISFFPVSGTVSGFGELHNADFFFLRWGSQRRARIPYDFGVSGTFLYSLQSVQKSMTGGEFSFTFRRLIMQSRNLSATWMTGGSTGFVVSFPGSTLTGIPEYYSIKLTYPNVLRWYTDLGYHNVYWGAGFNLTISILWGLNSGALVFMDAPFVIGYLMMYMRFHCFMEIGLVPSLIVNANQGTYVIGAVTFSLGFQFGGSDKRIIRPRRR
jgi:hypothetical protein